MACKPHCVCKCGHTGCECWDGIRIDHILSDGEVEKKGGAK